MKQRTQKVHHINEILKQIQLTQKWDEKYVLHQLKTNWKNLIGEKFADHTEKIEYKHSTLTIFFDHASVKNEFSFLITKFKKTLSDFFNEDIIKEVRLK